MSAANAPTALSDAPALRALDVFEAFVDSRVLADFRKLPVDLRVLCKEPMGLQRMRDKIGSDAYVGWVGWLIDLPAVFGRFDHDPSGSVRIRMADALFWLLDTLVRIVLCGLTAVNEAELERWQAEVKQLQPGYIADQEMRLSLLRLLAPPLQLRPSPTLQVPAERNRAQLIQDKAQLKQSNAELQRQLNEHAEHVAKFPRLQAELRWMDAELADARRMRMAADAAAAMQAESSRCDLETVQRRLVVESTVRREAQVAAADAHERSENTRRQLEAETKVNQQLQSEQAQWDQEMTRVRQSVAQFTREKRQLDQEKAQLQQQLNKHAEKLASSQEQNAAAGSSQSDRLITVKQEKIDAVADAHGAAQQAAKAAAGKRKAESELESEAKRRRSVEGELASLTEQMDEQDKCIVCFDKQPDALFLRCKHLVCCSECAETIMRGAAAGAACPTCRKPLRARDVIKVFRA